MRGWLWVVAALAFMSSYATSLSAADSNSSAQSIDLKEHFFNFTGVDANSKNSYSAWLGSTIAPFSGLDETGFRIALFGIAGTYKYLGGDDVPLEIKGRWTGGDLLVGYTWIQNNVSTKLMIGANVQDQKLTRPDPGNAVQGVEWGFKAQGDISIALTPETVVFGLGQYSTVFQTYLATAKFGYDLLPAPQQTLYLGPQISTLGNERFREWRAGVHLTALNIDRVNFEMGVGFSHQNDTGNGVYGSIGASLQF